MQAKAFLDLSGLVIVQCSDDTWHRLTDKTSRKWKADFLYVIAGKGENVRNMADGTHTDGVFTNTIRSYETLKHHKVTR